MTLYVVTGSPGCGKSTWVRHTAKTGDIRFDSDAITNLITGKTEDKHHHDNTVSKISRAARDAGIREAIKHRHKIDIYVLKSSLSKEDERKWRRYGAKFIVVDPGYEQAKAWCKASRPGYKHRMVDAWYNRRHEWPRDARIIHPEITGQDNNADALVPEDTPQAAHPARDKTITELGLGWDHQKQRKRLLTTLRDGTPCWWCGEAMYKKAERNFDGAALEADHSKSRRDYGPKQLADRLLHRTCNRQRGAGDRDHERPAIAPQRRPLRRVPTGTQTVW